MFEEFKYSSHTKITLSDVEGRLSETSPELEILRGHHKVQEGWRSIYLAMIQFLTKLKPAQIVLCVGFPDNPMYIKDVAALFPLAKFVILNRRITGATLIDNIEEVRESKHQLFILETPLTNSLIEKVRDVITSIISEQCLCVSEKPKLWSDMIDDTYTTPLDIVGMHVLPDDFRKFKVCAKNSIYIRAYSDKVHIVIGPEHAQDVDVLYEKYLFYKYYERFNIKHKNRIKFKTHTINFGSLADHSIESEIWQCYNYHIAKIDIIKYIVT